MNNFYKKFILGIREVKASDAKISSDASALAYRACLLQRPAKKLSKIER
jgi:hypothetical protein